MAQSNVRVLVLLLLTSGFFLTGILLDCIPGFVESKIKTTVELATNQEILSIWSKPPVDFNSYYWLYDVMNVEEFMAGEKIQVRKVGPFRFILTYNMSRTFKLHDSTAANEAALDEPLRLLNPIYASMLESSRSSVGKLDPSTKTQVLVSAQRTLERFNESLIMNLTPRSALLGRPIPMLKKIRKMAETFGLDVKLPARFDSELFGFVALVNNTQSGPFEIYTGYRASMPSLGELISYEGRKRQTEFQGKCNRMQTSLGELRPMPIITNQILELYRPEFCRIIRLRPNFENKMREGMAIGYSFMEQDWLSAEENTDNSCYCVPNNFTNDNYCSLNGAIELAPCSYMSPLILTINNMEPDKKITQTIANWHPDLRDSALDPLHPPNTSAQFLILKRLGVPISGDVTITMFMKVTRDPSFRQTSNVPEVSYVPLVMVREQASIPPKLARIIVNVEGLLALSNHIKVVMYMSGIVLLGWLTSHYYGRSNADRVVPTSAAMGAAGNGPTDQPGDDTGAAGSAGTFNRLSSSVTPTSILNGQVSDNVRHENSNQAAQSNRDSEKASQEVVNDINMGAGNDGDLEKRNRNGSGGVYSSDLEQRATSADSIRSLPPSRLSRSSIDEELLAPGATETVNPSGTSGESDNLQTKLSGENNSNELNKNQQGASSKWNPKNGTLAQVQGSDGRGNGIDSTILMTPRKGQEEIFSTDAAALLNSISNSNPFPANANAIENRRFQQQESSSSSMQPSSRIFSKVDELRAQKSTQTSNFYSANLNSATISIANQAASKDSDKLVTLSNGRVDSINQNEKQLLNSVSQADSYSQKSQTSPSLEKSIGTTQLVTTSPISSPIESSQASNSNANNSNNSVKKSKTWFMKVCSNFVRMLSDIRTTISDASQLNMNENTNDYQDKQLEMLAGKIDNWYNGMQSDGPSGISVVSESGEGDSTNEGVARKQNQGLEEGNSSVDKLRSSIDASKGQVSEKRVDIPDVDSKKDFRETNLEAKAEARKSFNDLTRQQQQQQQQQLLEQQMESSNEELRKKSCQPVELLQQHLMAPAKSESQNAENEKLLANSDGPIELKEAKGKEKEEEKEKGKGKEKEARVVVETQSKQSGEKKELAINFASSSEPIDGDNNRNNNESLHQSTQIEPAPAGGSGKLKDVIEDQIKRQEEQVLEKSNKIGSVADHITINEPNSANYDEEKQQRKRSSGDTTGNKFTDKLKLDTQPTDQVNSSTHKAETNHVQGKQQQRRDPKTNPTTGLLDLETATLASTNNQNNNFSAQSKETIITNNNKSDTSLDESELPDGVKEIADDKASALEQIEQALGKHSQNDKNNNAAIRTTTTTTTTNTTIDRETNATNSKNNSIAAGNVIDSSISLSKADDLSLADNATNLIADNQQQTLNSKQTNVFDRITALPIGPLVTMSKKLLAH